MFHLKVSVAHGPLSASTILHLKKLPQSVDFHIGLLLKRATKQVMLYFGNLSLLQLSLKVISPKSVFWYAFNMRWV